MAKHGVDLRRGRWRWIGLMLAVLSLLAAVTGLASAAAGPVFSVMNTSETPPDGVWFRNSPHTADTSRVTGLGVYVNERVQLQCYAWGDAVGQYNDTLWYLVNNVSRPSNNGAPNQGYLNAHYINDGQNANVVDAGVLQCGAAAPPPAAVPAVSLAQGPAAPAGYRYAVTLANFAANAAVSISCRDSANPGGFYTFSLTTNSTGSASTASYCYSGDGPGHWVVANGVESNHVAWGNSTGGGGGAPPAGGSSSPPGGGDARPTGEIAFPPLMPGSDYVLAPQIRDNSVKSRIRNTPIEAGLRAIIAAWQQRGFSYSYGNGVHYLDHTGTTRWFSFSDLDKQLPGFRGQFQYWLTQNTDAMISQVATVPAASSKTVAFDTAGTTQNWAGYNANNYNDDFRWALGHFFIRMQGRLWIGPINAAGDRPVSVQYRSFMYDIYNFDPSSQFAMFESLASSGWAAEFLEKGQSQTIFKDTTLGELKAHGIVLQFS